MKKVYLKACLTKNLGDDLFVKIITDRYKNKFYSTAVYKYNKGEVPNNLTLYSGFSIRLINKIIKTLSKRHEICETILKRNKDVFVYIAGSIFMERNGNLAVWKQIAKNYNNNIPRYILGANFGPYETEEFKTLIKENIIRNSKDVCFRDNYSYENFKDLPNVRQAPDIVYSLDVSKLNITNRKRVLISVIDCSSKVNEKYTEIYEQKIIELARMFIGKNYEVCLMSFCKYENDEAAIDSIMSKMDLELKEKVEVYNYSGNVEEALNVLADCEVIVGSRFHANIIGLTLGKTIIPIAYSDKTINALKDLGFEGKIVDIRKIDEFDINSINDYDLNYKINIDKEKVEAHKHFEKLDQILERK